MSEALWGTWGKNGTGLTTFMLKQWLKNYSIKPYAVRAGGEPVKGYHVKQFQEKLARYPQPESETEGGGYTGYNGYAADTKNNDVTDVTDVTPGDHPRANGNGQTEDDPEPGSFEPDDLDLPAFLDRRARA